MTTPLQHRPTRARISFTTITLALVGSILAVNRAAATLLADGQSIDLGPLQLRLIYNPGIAFSVGAELPTWIVLTATGLITTAVAIYSWRTAPIAALTSRVGLAAILAGALVNFLDRATDGVVTDYLHTGWFPTFNLADTLITLGAALLVPASLRKPSAANNQSADGGVRPSV